MFKENAKKLVSEYFKDIHHWINYAPQEAQYYNYDPHIVASSMKIEDTYQAFCLARASLSYMDVNNFGELISQNDIVHKTYIKSLFIQNALIYYNICIDLSWQVVWLYYGPSTLDLIYDKQFYSNSIKSCNLESLRYRLALAKQKKFYYVIEAFFTDSLTEKIREAYNYIKHRGTLYFENLGNNYKTLAITVNDFTPSMLYRDKFNMEEWIDNLIEFDDKFVNYFEDIINFIIPKGYTNTKFDFAAPFDYHDKLRNYLESKHN